MTDKPTPPKDGPKATAPELAPGPRLIPDFKPLTDAEIKALYPELGAKD